MPFKNGEPDWKFIDEYMRGLRYSKYADIKFLSRVAPKKSDLEHE
jgi:hypothetical protein